MIDHPGSVTRPGKSVDLGGGDGKKNRNILVENVATGKLLPGGPMMSTVLDISSNF